MGVHVRISCPHCRMSNLRIRPEYLGRTVTCKHCGQAFTPQTADGPADDPAPEQMAPAANEVWEQRAADLETEVRRLRGERAARADEHSSVLLQLGEARDQLRRLQELREQIDRAEEQLRQIPALRSQLTEAHARIEALAQENKTLHGRSAEADLLREELRSSQAEMDRLRTHLEGAQARLDELDPQAGVQEREAISAERDRLRDELAGLRSELNARTAESAEARRLTEELDAIRSGRDRLDADYQAALAREERLRVELSGMERSHSEEIARREGARAAFIRELEESHAHREAESQARREQELQTLLGESERRLDEERSRSAAEQRQLSEQVAAERWQSEQEHQSLRADVERLSRALEVGSPRNDPDVWRDAERDEEVRKPRSEADRDRSEHDRVTAELHDGPSIDPSEAACHGETMDIGSEASRTELAHRLAEAQDQLHRARIANERLRSLLRVFGVTQHLSEPGEHPE